MYTQIKRGVNLKKFVKEKYESLLLVLASVITFIVIYKTFGFFYGINDDVSMQKIAAGSSGLGVPDGHLIFVRYALGVVIASLFKLFPGIDWYGLFMIGCIFLCGFLILDRLFYLTRNSSDKVWIRLIGSALVLFVVIDTSILFQFTIVAGILAATAVFCVAFSKRIKISDYILAWVLIILASLVRKKVFYMTLPIAGIVTLSKCFESLKREDGKFPKNINQLIEQIKTKKKILIELAIVTFLGFGLFYVLTNVVEDWAYSESPWKEYVEYKHARSMIMDYYKWPDYDSNREFWDSLGISEEEHTCLKLYGILPNVDKDTIIEIAEYAEKSYYVSKKQHIANMRSLFLTAVESKKCRGTNIMLLFSLFVLLYYFFKVDGSKRIRIIIGITSEICILLYLLYGGRFPARIIMIYDYQCILVIWGLFLGDISNTKKVSKVLNMICLCAMVGLLGYTMINAKSNVDKQRSNFEIYLNQMDFIDDYSDSFFIIPTGTMVTTKPFTVSEKNWSSPNISGTYGWSVFSPWSDKKLEKYGLFQGEQIILKSNVYMFTTDLSPADKLSNYLYSEGLIDEDYEVIEERLVGPDVASFIVKWTPIKE